MTKMEGGLGGNKGNENVDLTKLSPAEIQKIIDDAKKQMADIDTNYTNEIDQVPAKDPEKKLKQNRIRQRYDKMKQDAKSKLDKFTAALGKKNKEYANKNEQAMSLLKELSNFKKDIAKKIEDAKTSPSQAVLDGYNKQITDKVAAILKFADDNDVRDDGILALRKEVGAPVVVNETKQQKKNTEAINNIVASVGAAKSAAPVSKETASLQQEILTNAEVSREKEVKDAEEALSKIKALEEKRIKKAEQDLQDQKELLAANTDTRAVPIARREKAVADAEANLKAIKDNATGNITAATKVFEKIKKEAVSKYEKAVGVTKELAVIEKTSDGNSEATLNGKETVEGLTSTIDHLKQEKENPNHSEAFKQGIEKRIQKLESKVAALEALQEEKTAKKESAIEEIKNRIEGPKEAVAADIEIPKTDEERMKAEMEARTKAFAEFQNKTKDALGESLYGPDAGMHADPEKTIFNSPQSKKDLNAFLEICKDKGTGNLAKQLIGTIPGFNDLPDGQKMLVLQGMNDELLTHVNQKAIEQFQKTLAGKKSKVGKMWMSVRKSYNMAKFRKAELAMLTENGAKNSVGRANFINEKVPALMEVFGKSGVGAYLNEKGKVMADFAVRKNFENASPYMQKTAEKYNEMANLLAHTPHENKDQYEKAEKAFAEAKEQFLAELHVHKASLGDKSPEFDANMDVERSEDLMRSMSLLAADQNTTRTLSRIANNSAAWAGFKDIIMQRGATTALSAGARAGVKAWMVAAGLIVVTGGVAIPVSMAATGAALASSAAISAIFGYYRGQKRAKGTIEDKDKLTRRGVHERNPLLRNQQLLKTAENNLANAKSSGAPRKEQRKLKKEIKSLKEAVAKAKATTVGMGNVGRHVDRLTKLRAEFDASTSPIEQQQILSRMKTVHDFIEAKLERREINFGKNKPGEPVEKKVFVLQSRLMNEMRKAQATIQSKLHEEEMMNIFDKNASGAELGADTRMRRLLKVHGEGNSSRNEEARKAYARSQGFKSMRNAAIASTAGVAMMHFAQEFGWHHPAEVSADETAPTPAFPNGPVPINNQPTDWNNFLNFGGKNGVPNVPGSGSQFNPNDPLGLGLNNGTTKFPYRIPGQVYPEPALHHAHEAVHHVAKHVNHEKPIHDPLDDIAARKHPEFPTWNEVNSHHFTKAQLEGINDHSHHMLEVALNKMSPELTQYFKTTDASAFMAHKVGNITSPEARELLQNMQQTEELLGTHPNPGETVEQYFVRMTEFRDRGEILVKINHGEHPFPSAEDADFVEPSKTVTSTVTETITKTKIELNPNLSNSLTPKEIMDYQFTPEQNSIIEKLYESRHAADMNEFFANHSRWLGKSAEHVMNRNEGGVWNPTKRDLDALMSNFGDETGIKPNGLSVEDYMKVIETYDARKDFLSGNYDTKAILDWDKAHAALEHAESNNTAPSGEVVGDVAGNAKADSWFDASVNEYFGGSKTWNNISHLQARYFMSNNEDYLSRNGIVDNDAALEFRRAFAEYVNANHITIGHRTTVEEVMREISQNQKGDNTVPFREMLANAHAHGSEAVNTEDYNPSMMEDGLRGTTAAEMRNYAPINLGESLREAAHQNALAEGYGLKSLDHHLSVEDQMWMRDHVNELLDNTELQNSGIQNMNALVSKLGENAYYANVSDQNLSAFIGAARPNGDAGKFYDLLQDLKKSDGDLINGQETVSDFMTKVYIRDVFDDFIRKNNVEAVTNNVTEGAGVGVR